MRVCVSVCVHDGLSVAACRCLCVAACRCLPASLPLAHSHTHTHTHAHTHAVSLGGDLWCRCSPALASSIKNKLSFRVQVGQHLFARAHKSRVCRPDLHGASGLSGQLRTSAMAVPAAVGRQKDNARNQRHSHTDTKAQAQTRRHTRTTNTP